MISVRIPNEIRKYKEKIALGMTARQLISTCVALAICAPLAIFGGKVWGDDLNSWLVLIVGLPILGFGWFKINELPFEKFMALAIRYYFLVPNKRKTKNENFFHYCQREVKKQERQEKEKIKKKVREQAALEKTFLLMEAEQKGELDTFNVDDVELVTVKNYKMNNDNNKDKKNKKEKKQKVDKVIVEGEALKKKMAENPEYLPTKKENALLKKYNARLLQLRKKEVENGKKKVNKEIQKKKKRKTAKTNLPKTVAQTIGYIADFEEGLFQISENKYSKSFKMSDINFAVAKEEEQVAIFCKYGEFLNYFPEDMNVQITVFNRVVSVEEKEKDILYRMQGDKYDFHRKEFNEILRKQMGAGKNDIRQDKYVTVTLEADNPVEALIRFHKVEAEVIANLHKIGCQAEVMSTDERLHVLHDFFRRNNLGEFKINYDWVKKQGLSSKDYIAPQSFVFKDKYFKIDDVYCQAVFLTNLPASLQDEFFCELADNDFPVITSMNVRPIAQDKALRLIKKQITGMEANIIEAQKKAIKNGYSPDIISHDLTQNYSQGVEMLDDCTNKNQKVFLTTATLIISGNSREELANNVKTVAGTASKYTCQLQPLIFQQEEALNQTLPLGHNTLQVDRALTTESTAIFMPFEACEVFDKGGMYHGLNQITRNVILIDRKKMKTPSGFCVGSSGSGKSFACKLQLQNVLLNDSNSCALIIDPENEYGDFARAYGGEVINISSGSNTHINPLDMELGYSSDENDNNSNPLELKSEYILSIVECMLSVNGSKTGITPQQKSIVDRCITRAYAEYIAHNYDKAYTPTLEDLQKEFDKEAESGDADALAIAKGCEYYTRGGGKMFSHKTNVDYNSRCVVFNVRDLGTQLKQIALLITLDFVWNKMIANKEKGIWTYCFIDEIHTLFNNEFAANYIKQLYKRGRKYGLIITGITQNVEDLLRSECARGMIGNSDYLLILNQNQTDLELLAGLLKISESQMSYVARADNGSGLIFAEKVIVPFQNIFPKDNFLYELISTKFGEQSSENGLTVEQLVESYKRRRKVNEESESGSEKESLIAV